MLIKNFFLFRWFHNIMYTIAPFRDENSYDVSKVHAKMNSFFIVGGGNVAENLELFCISTVTSDHV